MKFMKKLITTSAALMAAAAMLATGSANATDPLKIGFIYVGPIGDHGWSYQHNVGRLEIEQAFGSKVKTSYVETVPEGADAQRVIRRLASSGHGLIFTTSFGYMNPTIKVAKRFPKVHFEHATGFKRSKNVATYSARFYEGRHVVGLIAGKMTKTNILGYVASFPIPEVVRGINATIIAARSVNPKIKIKVIWVSSWFDPGKEADAAKAMIDQGADIIMQHTDSPAPLQVAQNAASGRSVKRRIWPRSVRKRSSPRSSIIGVLITSPAPRRRWTGTGSPEMCGAASSPAWFSWRRITKPFPLMSSPWRRKPARVLSTDLSMRSRVRSRTSRVKSSCPPANGPLMGCCSA